MTTCLPLARAKGTPYLLDVYSIYAQNNDNSAMNEMKVHSKRVLERFLLSIQHHFLCGFSEIDLLSILTSFHERPHGVLLHLLSNNCVSVFRERKTLR